MRKAEDALTVVVLVWYSVKLVDEIELILPFDVECKKEAEVLGAEAAIPSTAAVRGVSIVTALASSSLSGAVVRCILDNVGEGCQSK